MLHKRPPSHRLDLDHDVRSTSPVLRRALVDMAENSGKCSCPLLDRQGMLTNDAGPAEISTLEPTSRSLPTSNGTATAPRHPPAYESLPDAEAGASERSPLLGQPRSDARSFRSNRSAGRRAAPPRRVKVPSVKPQTRAIKTLYFLVTVLLFVSVSAFLFVALSTLHPWASRILPPHHGSTFLPFWYCLLSILILLLSLSYFAVPHATANVFIPLSSTVAFFSVVDIVAIGANPELRAKESWLTVSAAILLLVSALVAASSLGAVDKFLPAVEAASEAKRQNDEYERYQRRLREEEAESRHAAAVAVPVTINEPERPGSLAPHDDDDVDDEDARGTFGKRFKRACGVFFRFTGVTLPLLILHIAIVVALILMTADLVLRAFDSSREPPGRLWEVSPSEGGGPYRLHLKCGPFGGKHRWEEDLSAAPETNATLPRRTLLFFSPSGVAGQVAAEWALNISAYPSHPSGSRSTTKTKAHAHHRICYYDRPGYGFSDNAPTARLSQTVEALEQALDQSGEVERLTGRGGGRDLAGFVLVGQGFGGWVQLSLPAYEHLANFFKRRMVARVFAARNPRITSGVVFIDSQTEFTYFNPAERTARKTLRYLFSDCKWPPALSYCRRLIERAPDASAVVSPLGIRRYLALIFGTHLPGDYGSNPRGRLARILASARSGLNPSMARATLQEAHLAHTHYSSSYRDLDGSRSTYPDKIKTVVLSSAGRLGDETESKKRWTKGQEYLAYSLTREKDLLRWDKVPVKKDVCRDDKAGRPACEKAVQDLLLA